MGGGHQLFRPSCILGSFYHATLLEKRLYGNSSSLTRFSSYSNQTAFPIQISYSSRFDLVMFFVVRRCFHSCCVPLVNGDNPGGHFRRTWFTGILFAFIDPSSLQHWASNDHLHWYHDVHNKTFLQIGVLIAIQKSYVPVQLDWKKLPEWLMPRCSY